LEDLEVGQVRRDPRLAVAPLDPLQGRGRLGHRFGDAMLEEEEL
jgi:hypothetical protein